MRFMSGPERSSEVTKSERLGVKGDVRRAERLIARDAVLCTVGGNVAEPVELGLIEGRLPGSGERA